MQTLPDSAPRELVHTRVIATKGFRRLDGLWDLEAELSDVKTHPTGFAGDHARAAGEPIHRMQIRLTMDDAYKIHDAVAAMPSTPFPECLPAASPFVNLVGAVIGPGWRKQIDVAMGGTAGCTHLRELLAVMATVAYQTIGSYRRHEPSLRDTASPGEFEPPHYMGKCISWDFNGTVIARVAPQFIGYARNGNKSP